MRPKLSIAIPTMDRPRDLADSLFFLQERIIPFVKGGVEVVVLDSSKNSQDTKDICLEKPYVRYFFAPAQGSCKAHTSAFFLCEGEYSFFMGDDDFIEKDGLLHAISFLDENPSYAAVFAPWNETYDRFQTHSGPHHYLNEDAYIKKNDFNALKDLIQKSFLCPESCVARTDILQKSIFHTYMYKDAFWLKNLLRQGDILYKKDIIYVQGYRALEEAPTPRNPLTGVSISSHDNMRGFMSTNARIIPSHHIVSSFGKSDANLFLMETLNLYLRFYSARLRVQVQRSYAMGQYGYMLSALQTGFIVSKIFGNNNFNIQDFNSIADDALIIETTNMIIKRFTLGCYKAICYPYARSPHAIQNLNNFFKNVRNLPIHVDESAYDQHGTLILIDLLESISHKDVFCMHDSILIKGISQNKKNLTAESKKF